MRRTASSTCTSRSTEADAADEALTNGDPDRALDLANSALGRLDHALLPDVDAVWLVGYRTRLRWARTRSLQIAAAAHRLTGRFAQATDLASRAVDEDPLAEESHRQLIQAHAASGDRAAALRAYESCRRILAAELGIAPDQQTADLYLRILGTEHAEPSGPRRAGPLLGREPELAGLGERVTGGGVLSIVGPGGIGKSRLAAEYAADRGNGFDGACVFVDVENEGRGGDLTVALATVLGASTGPGADVLGSVLAELAVRGRSLLVLDGIDHVADEAAGLIAAGVCLVPRDEHRHDLSRRAGARRRVRAPACRHSTPTVTATRASSRTPTRPAQSLRRTPRPAPRSSTCAARSVASRSASSWRRGQVADISLRDLADRLRENLDDEGRAVEVVDSVVAGTIALLDDVELDVFRRLSVLGGPADLALVEAAVSDETVPAKRVVRVLANLAARALVRLDRTATRWRYDQHPLLRAAARERLTGRDRRRAFDQLATALFTRLPATATTAPRLADTDVLIPAVRSVLGGALEGDADVGTALRLAYWMHRYWAARAVDEGIAWLEQLLAVAAADDPFRGSAEVALGYLLHWSGRPDAAAEHLLAATTLVDADHPLLPMAHFFIANAAENRQPEVARRHFALAIAAATAMGRDDVAARCRLGLAVVVFEAGERDDGIRTYESALREVERQGDDDAVAVHLPQYASMLISMSRLDDAHEVLQRAERHLVDEVRIAAMHAAAVRARLERHRSRPDVARRHAVRVTEMVARAGVGRLHGVVSPTLAMLDLGDGNVDDAVAELVTGSKAAIAVRSSGRSWPTSSTPRSSWRRRPGGAPMPRHCWTLSRRSAAQAQVTRGEPEQAELDAALRDIGLAVSAPSGSIDLSSLSDLIVGLAVS